MFVAGKQPEGGVEIVARATDGTALRSLRGRECDLALMDWYMPPEMGPFGRDLLTTVRERFPNVALVVMTASLQPSLLGACLAAGVKGLFDKRGNGEELLRILRQASQGKTCISPGFEAVLERRYLSRHYWGVETDHLLTPREREVMDLSNQGYTGRKIAAQLGRSEKTISRQRRAALAKLGLNPGVLPG